MDCSDKRGTASVSQRPWGTYETLHHDDEEGFLVKKIVVNPSSRLSLQSHEHRSELWVVVRGNGTVTVGDDAITVGPKSHVFIPRGAKHRISNSQNADPLVFVEVQLGSVLLESDIHRYQDDYDRA